MYVHTDKITHGDLRDPFNHNVMLHDVWMDLSDEHGSRSRARKFHIRLAATPKPGRRRKRNMQHILNDPEGIVAATYDEWGVWIRDMFEIDPDAIIGNYKGRDDFHNQTHGRFEPHPWTLSHPADCTGCRPASLGVDVS